MFYSIMYDIVECENAYIQTSFFSENNNNSKICFFKCFKNTCPELLTSM